MILFKVSGCTHLVKRHLICKYCTKSTTLIKYETRLKRWPYGRHDLQARWISNVQTSDDPSLAWKRLGKVFDKGPDQILPSEAPYTWEREGATKIQFTEKENGSLGRLPLVSVPTFVKSSVEKFPNDFAISSKINGEWKKWTFEQYYQDIEIVAKAFLALGLEKNNSVGILSFNRREWFLANFGAIFAGGCCTGIYTTNTPAATTHCAQDSNVNIFVLENEEQLAKIRAIRDELPMLKAVVLLDGQPQPQDQNVITWDKLMEIGARESDRLLKERLKTIAINQCCSYIYTSGTTGKPKGVMLSHDNLVWTSKRFAESIVTSVWADGNLPQPFSMVSYLPLSHIAAQISDLYIGIACPKGMDIYFADPDSLKGSLVKTLKEARPSLFLGVPRVYEKIYENMVEIGNKNSGLKKLIVKIARARSTKYNTLKIGGDPNPRVIGFNLFEKLIFSKIKEQLGLDHGAVYFCGAAPLNPDTLNFFFGLNMPISQIYGASETTGPCTTQCWAFFKHGSIGKVLPGGEVSIFQPDEQNSGELVFRGRMIMMGYIGRKDQTLKCMREDGSFHSGDIAIMDSKDFITLSGRKREIIITAGGENVAPVEIEDRVKANLAIVSNAVVIGEGQKCLSLLLTLKCVLDPNTGEPTDQLTDFVKDWISVNGNLEAKTAADVLGPASMTSNHELRKAIQKKIDQVNSQGVSRAQKIRNWCILPKDFSFTGGEFGPSLKLVRPVVNNKYKKEIKALYKTLNVCVNEKHE